MLGASWLDLLMFPRAGTGELRKEIDVVIGLEGHLAADIKQDLKKFRTTVHTSEQLFTLTRASSNSEAITERPTA